MKKNKLVEDLVFIGGILMGLGMVLMGFKMLWTVLSALFK